MKHISRLLIVALPCLLAACTGGDVRSTMGLDRDAPDEFTVLSRPPLSVPPDFTLRPPRPGEADNRQPSADAQARGVILGRTPKPTADVNSLSEPTVDTAVTPVISNDAPSGATSSFLKRAGTNDANDDIRQQLGEDVAKPADTSNAKSLYEKITGAEKREPVVDAKKEAERIRANKDAGKPVTNGDVPVQDEKSGSVLDKVF